MKLEDKQTFWSPNGDGLKKESDIKEAIAELKEEFEDISFSWSGDKEHHWNKIKKIFGESLMPKEDGGGE